MTHSLKIKDSSWITGTKMIHLTEDGKSYFGPPLPATNKAIIVEVSSEPMEGECYYIIRVVE